MDSDGGILLALHWGREGGRGESRCEVMCRWAISIHLKESTVFIARLTLWRRLSRWVGPARGRTDVIGRM